MAQAAAVQETLIDLGTIPTRRVVRLKMGPPKGYPKHLPKHSRVNFSGSGTVTDIHFPTRRDGTEEALYIVEVDGLELGT
jgi:hypothetical protein